MGHTLEAVIAESALLRAAVADLAEARHVELCQGLALMPLTDTLHDQGPLGFHPFSELRKSPAWLVECITDWSLRGPVAYLEVDFFGGVGTQAAAVWSQGALAWGPVRVEVGEPFPVQGSPVSQALRLLGAHTAPGDRDEFESVGLRAHRSTQDWAERATG